MLILQYQCLIYYILFELLCSDHLREYLARRGIETRNYFFPNHLQPAYLDHFQFSSSLPNSEYLSRTGFYLPTYYYLTEGDVIFICDQISMYFEPTHVCAPVLKNIESVKSTTTKKLSGVPATAVFDAYAMYYDILYQDKNYDLESSYVSGILEKSVGPPSITSGSEYECAQLPLSECKKILELGM